MQAAEERSYGRLTFVDKEGKRGVDYTINKGVVVIGREKGCDLVIPRREVSRRHALLRVDAEGIVWLESTGREPVAVNGKPAIEPAELFSGDQIEIQLEGRTKVIWYETALDETVQINRSGPLPRKALQEANQTAALPPAAPPGPPAAKAGGRATPGRRAAAKPAAKAPAQAGVFVPSVESLQELRAGLRKTGAGAPTQGPAQGAPQTAAGGPGPWSGSQPGPAGGGDVSQRGARAAELSRAKKRKSVRFNIPPEVALSPEGVPTDATCALAEPEASPPGPDVIVNINADSTAAFSAWAMGSAGAMQEDEAAGEPAAPMELGEVAPAQVGALAARTGGALSRAAGAAAGMTPSREVTPQLRRRSMRGSTAAAAASAEVDRKRRSCSGSRNGTPAAKGPAPAHSPGDVRLDAQLDSALAAAAAAAANPDPTPGPGLQPGEAAVDPTEVLPESVGQAWGGRAPTATPASGAGSGAAPRVPGCLDAAALAARLEALATPGAAATPGMAATPGAMVTPAGARGGVRLVAGGDEWTVQIPAGFFATPAAAAQGVAVSIPREALVGATAELLAAGAPADEEAAMDEQDASDGPQPAPRADEAADGGSGRRVVAVPILHLGPCQPVGLAATGRAERRGSGSPRVLLVSRPSCRSGASNLSLGGAATPAAAPTPAAPVAGALEAAAPNTCVLMPAALAAAADSAAPADAPAAMNLDGFPVSAPAGAAGAAAALQTHAVEGAGQAEGAARKADVDEEEDDEDEDEEETPCVVCGAADEGDTLLLQAPPPRRAPPRRASLSGTAAVEAALGQGLGSGVLEAIAEGDEGRESPAAKPARGTRGAKRKDDAPAAAAAPRRAARARR
ncbi:hypothetical protein WJX81_008059 [Elliptochloris bilobata]|uniref:FHA domain-containing protein n=1 Tax=Elliptochloris bilobata TaxID=381761 RepID=A0AAW1RUW3_9CHLO